MGLYPCPDLVWWYDMREKFLTATLVLSLIFGLFFTTASVNAAGACYVSPCYLSATPGKSFQVTMTGFVFILQPVYGLYFLKKRCTQTLGGAFIGATLLLSILALMTSVLWKSELNAAYSFVEHLNLVDSGAVLSVSKEAATTFQSLHILAAFEFIMMLLSYCLLCICREYFCEDDFAVSFTQKKLATRNGGFGSDYQQSSTRVPNIMGNSPLL